MRNRFPQLKGSWPFPKSRSASYLITGAEAGISYNNTGATGAITLTLPKAVAGAEFNFLVTVAQTLTVAPQSTDVIRGKAAGASYASATIGNHFFLTCQLTGTWDIISNVGFA